MTNPDQKYLVTGAWLEGEDPGDRKFLEIGDLVRACRAVCHILAHDDHLGERANGDRRHRIVPAAPFRVGKSAVLCLGNRGILGHCRHRRAAHHIAVLVWLNPRTPGKHINRIKL